MKRLLLALALLAGAPAGAQVPGTVGINAAVRNQVSLKTARDAAPRAARLREAVSLGDAIITAAASQLQVLLLDKSVFTVGANARVTIDRFVYDPARGTGEIAASVARGAFRFMSGGAARGGRRTVTTPVASIGIRGTLFDGVVGEDALLAVAGEAGAPTGTAADPATATLVVLRGPGPRTDGLDRPGAIDVTSGGVTATADRPGEAIFVGGPGLAPVGPFALSDAASARVAGLLRAAAEAGRPDTGPTTIEAASVASGLALAQLEFAGGGLAFDPLGTPFPVLRSDELGVPCLPSGGGSGGGVICAR